VVEVPKRFGGSFTLGDFAIAWMGGRITRAMAIKMVDDMDCTKLRRRLEGSAIGNCPELAQERT